MANSENWGGARQGAGPHRRNIRLDKPLSDLIAQVRRDTPHVTEAQIVSGLMFLVSDMWSLSNHAEVFAPELLHNEQWKAMKSHLEQRMDEIGVTGFIGEIGTLYLAHLEEQDDDEE